ncbi:hypothetical protein BO71DRAFT_111649 [Aspergillus ellipticus CBS 707.79]|uniref:Uncharacterized protein n=1 Tax=Aspergillus ellipticus CBS 707.79 TaxID=1448320 RepID=A0A319DMF9_9EURO|nr:hypothetical protein BO71DRAFT_111649 [Aspergillus ellipticus CBS 707.79]
MMLDCWGCAWRQGRRAEGETRPERQRPRDGRFARESVGRRDRADQFVQRGHSVRWCATSGSDRTGLTSRHRRAGLADLGKAGGWSWGFQGSLDGWAAGREDSHESWGRGGLVGRLSEPKAMLAG